MNVLYFVMFPVQWKLNLKKTISWKQGCFWSNEYWYDNVNFLQKTNGRPLLLEQDTFRWDDDVDICFVLD